jgi:hypothetical protein
MNKAISFFYLIFKVVRYYKYPNFFFMKLLKNKLKCSLQLINLLFYCFFRLFDQHKVTCCKKEILVLWIFFFAFLFDPLRNMIETLTMRLSLRTDLKTCRSYSMSPLTTHYYRLSMKVSKFWEGALSSTPGGKNFLGGHAMQKLTTQFQQNMTANFRHTSKKLEGGLCKNNWKKSKNHKKGSKYSDLTVNRSLRVNWNLRVNWSLRVKWSLKR